MSGEGFLSRWSRRKRAAEAGLSVPDPQAEAPAAKPPAPATGSVAVAGAAPVPDADPAPGAMEAPEEPGFDLASLPSIDSLTAESDFSAFLRTGVPEALRRAALRKAWALDPVVSTYIGPADYAWDFNAPDGVPGFALELGGDVRKLLAQAIGLDRDEERAPAEAAETVETGDAAEAPGAPAPPTLDDPAVAPAMADGAAPVAMAAIAPPSEPEQGPQPPAARPRRHGSAIPG
ncbi:DUF3306 domain-containing protein [Roseomonas sp. PWR1]|uniref:DUF3306 domain-containing protein n=1 Tax=Roseomonas nitratireducens TaxID=2820810 RepID=A0ABS4AQE2_9PROT|nr:DUF3306 domain-containing protein [Neoroseomonas nitratireducens]